MKLQDWDRLRIFYHVAVAGNFTKGAESLCLSQSAVSRHILALEDSLETSLFYRHPRGLILTEVGKGLFKTAQEVFLKFQEAEGKVEQELSEPQGYLRISVPSYFSEKWLAPRLRVFLEKYPKIQLVLLVQETSVGLENGLCEGAILPWSSGVSDLIQQKFLTYALRLYGSVNYLSAQGRPQSLETLRSHRFILYEPLGVQKLTQEEGSETKAFLESLDPSKILLRSNSYGVLEYGIRQGHGVGFLPSYALMEKKEPGLGGEEQRLESLFPLSQGEEKSMCFVYPPGLRSSKKINVFKEFLVDEGKELPDQEL